MANTATVLMGLTIRRELNTTLAFSTATQSTVLQEALNLSKEHSSASTPAVTKIATWTQALSGGAATIDLTAIADSLGTVDATGLKLAAIYIQAKAANTAGITWSKGASNGYSPESTTWTFTLDPGQRALFYFCSATAITSGAVGSGAKTIDLAGTGTESLDIVAIFG